MINIIGTAITGILVSKALMKSASKENLLPSFRGKIEVKHMIQGRIRFYIPKLVGNENEKEVLMQQMIKINEIEKIEINTISGSLLIYYTSEKIEPMLIFSVIVRLLGLEEQLDKKEKSIIVTEIQQFWNALNKSVYEKTQGILDVRTLVTMCLILGGLKKIVIDKNSVTPGPYNLLWWAYGSLGLGGK